MISRQLELGFENQPGIKPLSPGRDRSSRARWWFEQMRGVVNHAPDWPPASELPSSGVPPPASASPSPATAASRPAPAAPHRWKFSRPRRLIWE